MILIILISIIVIVLGGVFSYVDSKKNSVEDCLKSCSDSKWKLSVFPIYENRFCKIPIMKRIFPGFDCEIVLQSSSVRNIIPKVDMFFYVNQLNKDLCDKGIPFVAKILYIASTQRRFEIIIFPKVLAKYWN